MIFHLPKCSPKWYFSFRHRKRICAPNCFFVQTLHYFYHVWIEIEGKIPNRTFLWQKLDGVQHRYKAFCSQSITPKNCENFCQVSFPPWRWILADQMRFQGGEHYLGEGHARTKLSRCVSCWHTEVISIEKSNPLVCGGAAFCVEV